MTHKNLTLKGLKKLARRLAKSSEPNNRVFGLIGPLGAGKTTFVKELGQALGIGNAKSPTFTIVHCYNGPGKSLYHIDLYRLEKDREIDAIGLDEILEDAESLVAIEWADKFPGIMERCDSIIKFEITKDNKRNVAIENT